VTRKKGQKTTSSAIKTARKHIGSKFDSFMKELETEAKLKGSEAEAELFELREHYRRIRITQQVTVAVDLVCKFFGNKNKAALWFNTPNPLLGGVSPVDTISLGKVDKLLKFIRNCLAENEPPPSQKSN